MADTDAAWLSQTVWMVRCRQLRIAPWTARPGGELLVAVEYGLLGPAAGASERPVAEVHQLADGEPPLVAISWSAPCCQVGRPVAQATISASRLTTVPQ